MVTVTNYAVIERKDGTKFTAIEITGGLEIQQSQTSEGFYCTVKRCSLPSTLTEDVAKMIIGQQVEGDVVRVEASPYEFVNKRTGEVMMLEHSFAYSPKD